jgi:hypothetical protein
VTKVRGRSNTSGDDPTEVDIYVSNSTSVWGTAVASNITTWQDRNDWDGDAVIDCTAKEGRFVKVEIIDTEDGSNDLVFGNESSPFQILDVYGSEVSGGGHPQVILIQTGAVSLLVLSACLLLGRAKK